MEQDRTEKPITDPLQSSLAIKNTSDSEAKDLSLLFKLRHISLEWILSSTSHGLPSVFRTDQIYLKIIWLACFVASTAACAYVVINYIISYLEYSVNVSTTIETETPINFPAVTICNLNPFNTERALPFMNRMLTMNNFAYAFNVTTLESAFNLASEVSSILKGEAAGNPDYNSTSRRTLGFYLDEMMVSCRFGVTDCTLNDFSYFRSHDYGNCYTFNSGYYANGSVSTLNSLSNAGPGHGFEVELFAGASDNEYFTIHRGFYVVIHNQSYTPMMDNEGISVGLGMQTNIGINRIFYYKMPNPYSSCIVDTKSISSSTSLLYQAILTTLGEKIYRQKYCYKLCYQQNVIQECSCYDSAYANPYPTSNGQSIDTCHTYGEIRCLIDVKSHFESSNIKELCEDDCPEECNAITYTTSVSTSSYPSKFYLNWLLMQSSIINKTALSSEVKESIARITIFYNDISYTTLTESASITWDSLVGNIGGQLGLFIGISILSLVEIVEVAFEVIRTIYLHRRLNRLKNT